MIAAPVRPLSKAERLLAKRRNEQALIDLADHFAAAVVTSFHEAFKGVTDRLGDVVTAAGFVSPDDLNHIPANWAEQVNATLVPAVRELYDVGGMSALIQFGDAAEARANAVHLDALPEVLDRRALDYLDGATNRLVGIGDTAWHSVREALSKGFEAGESVPDMSARVQEAMSASEARADLIARTETTGAANAGQLDAIRSLEEYGPPFKQWLSTIDARTRPEHQDADGQTVHVNELFDVGGEALDSPGDPAGSAAMVCNCRCSLLYLSSEEAAASDGTIDPEGRQTPEVPLDFTSDAPTGSTTEFGWLNGTPEPITPDVMREVEAGIGRIREAFPNAPELRNVMFDSDMSALGGASNDQLIFSNRYLSDEFMAAHAKEFGEGRAHPLLHGTGREFTAVHEYSHVLDKDLLHNHREAYDAIRAHLNEEVLMTYAPPFGDRMLPRIQHGLLAPSAYGGESQYEWVAEAVTDYLRNGSAASETSRFIGNILKGVYG